MVQNWGAGDRARIWSASVSESTRVCVRVHARRACVIVDALRICANVDALGTAPKVCVVPFFGRRALPARAFWVEPVGIVCSVGCGWGDDDYRSPLECLRKYVSKNLLAFR